MPCMRARSARHLTWLKFKAPAADNACTHADSRHEGGSCQAIPWLLLTTPMPGMQHKALTHILVVEDDLVNRDVVGHLLHHFGYRVDAVDNGWAALTAVQATAYDLVLMDCHMHDMDGLETTRRMRRGDAGPHGHQVPIVALTAQAFVEDCDACLAAGMSDFLTKPVDASHLLTTIERWVDRGTKHSTSPRAHGTCDDHDSPPSPAVFDPTVLAALPMVVDGSQPAYGEEVLAMFFKTAPQILASLRQATANNDIPVAQRAAHTLKSSSATVGALALAACAADAEARLRAETSCSPGLPDQLDSAFESLCSVVQSRARHMAERTVASC